jgi:hypothetical protein
MKKTLLVLLACALAACQPDPTLSDASTPEAATSEEQGANVYFFGEALWAESVFDRDVQLIERSVGERYTNLSGVKTFSMTQGSDTRPAAAKTVARFAAEARDGQDMVIAFFTSHGIEGSLAVLPSAAAESFDWPAADVSDFLAPLEADRHIVILQACHSGSLIPALKHPNRIIIAAARADRSSFGCDPAEDSTWFVKALTEEMPAGGSWQQIFERTRTRVLQYETDQGITEAERSYPQFNVGAEMQDIWTGESDPY